ncbi:MAG TPA: amidase, partial [Solirubrobacteraceae bacterium]|nr:amidase [Solirubrobacteraceae bacterium]
MVELARLGVLEAASALRARRISAAELLAACEVAIDARNGGEPSFEGAPTAVNAWVRRYPEIAAAQAQAADERLARERDAAPLLCGVPIGLKDLYAVAGLPLTASSRVLEGHVASADATAWARLSAHGMVLVGHTHTHEFAAGGTTDQVGNPYALERSAGGSSGGSAAALAAAMVPATLGTDTAGSLRIPAALCGVSSLKPTHGRVPIDGIEPLARSLDHAGPMARSLADCGALLAALAQDGAQSTPLMPPPAPLRALPSAPRGGPRPLAGVRV